LRSIFGGAIGHLSNVPVAYAVGSGADFHCLPIAPGHFLMGSTCAELKPIDTGLTNATGTTECAASWSYFGTERGTTPLVEITRVRVGTHGEIRRLVCLDGFEYFDQAKTSIAVLVKAEEQ
jgi:hypothetical protein